jgi:paraquat-inducible protein B
VPETPELPEADIRARHHRPFHWVWLIPLIAAGIAGFLGWQAWRTQGDDIVIQFNSGDGLVAGQTKVRHKAVELGTVRDVSLSQDLRSVEVRVEMHRQADRFLTENARFWVVRPRLTGASITGLDTLLSGSYIEMDPGVIGKTRQTRFQGLEEPPAVRSDEPGTTFALRTGRLGSISSGAPVFYRDANVGEVLGYDRIVPGQPILLHLFIRKPFDGYVRQGTHFWNASGISVQLGAEGLNVRLESLQAVLSGGIAFSTPASAMGRGHEPDGTPFTLYSDQAAAIAAGYSTRLRFVTYFHGSVRGLAIGSPVEFLGIQVGTVTDIHLVLDPDNTRVEVKMEVQPERVLRPGDTISADTLGAARELVRRGLRVQLRSANLLTGQMVLAADFLPDAGPATVEESPDGVVIPNVAGGLDSLTSNLSQIASKLDSLPLEQIARNLNDTLRGASEVVNSPDLRETLASVAATTRRLPEVAQSLQATADNARRMTGSFTGGYGADSQFSRDLERLLGQVSDAARSVRLLADYLDQHPEALLRGRLGQAEER